MSLLLNAAISFLTLLIFFPGLAMGQVSHTVIVGQQGSFYDPPTLSAQLNDTVTFVFAGAAHSVTQTSFDNPCSPLKGGFNSGITGIGNNVSASPPTWTIQITNVSQPIWFFCESTVPLSHCASGMVGVINPNSIDQYNQFLAAAKAVVGTPPPQPSLTLSGVGAFATNSPAPSTSSAPTTTSSSSSSTVVSTTTPSIPPSSPTPTPIADTSESNFEAHKGGIIAGIVVGAIVIIVLLMLLFYVLKRRRDQETLRDFFSYSVPSPVNMTSRSGLAALPSSNNIGGTTASSGSNSRPNPAAPAIISTTRRPSNEFDFSSGYPRGHAYAAVGLDNKDPYAEEVASSSDTYADTYATDSIITTSAGGISGVSGNTGATRAARRKASQDRGFDNGRHAPTDGPPLVRKTSQTAHPATRNQKLADNSGAVNRPPSPDGAPPPLYQS